MIYIEQGIDLFSLSDDYMLAHCVSADYVLGAGIARQFRRRFDMARKLKITGTYGSWDDSGRCVIINMTRNGKMTTPQMGELRVANLVTKRYCVDKPTLKAIRESLEDLREQLQTVPEYKKVKHTYPLIRDFLIEEEKMLILETDTDKIEITSPEQLQKIVDDRGQKGLTIQRFKGLGEMMPEQLWETTMNPASRTLLKVNIEDAMLCDQLFDVLMGDKVEPRRDFIESHAVYATNIDT